MLLHHVGDEVAALRRLQRYRAIRAARRRQFTNPMRVLPNESPRADCPRASRAPRRSRAALAHGHAHGLDGSVASADLETMVAAAGLEVVGARVDRLRLTAPSMTPPAASSSTPSPDPRTDRRRARRRRPPRARRPTRRRRPRMARSRQRIPRGVTADRHRPFSAAASGAPRSAAGGDDRGGGLLAAAGRLDRDGGGRRRRRATSRPR